MTAGATGPAVLRTLVVGSCVSRDTVPHLPDGDAGLVGYVARQSLISAYAPPVVLLEPPAIASPFQQRMVRGDFASDLPAVLRRLAGGVDLVLWDLVDERLGVYVLPDDTAVTRTVDLVAAQAETDVAAAGVLVRLGEEAHLEMWREAATRFVAGVAELHPGAALVAVGLPWAELTTSGAPTPASFGVAAAEANRRYEPYYAVVEALGAPVVGRGLAVRGSVEHPWGEAPFHYDSAAYRAVADAVLAVVSAHPSSRRAPR
ncbi:hypothetical protein C8046_09600 [Serinibacter arcticus]|uniref:SGNH hydrolase-type esterase domain-containing protein n=1 Tax=Serinibacter arcticus TaxID=1655435 RepID=A0A2U1ZV62_9MICO|nr:DUF6270 domain-containing protein [Serinibacter arcticus]PWD50868.1 hypothetical protein C8046_09600 [Serinibacter arcticus]